jgi:CBS domain-containing protein
MGFLNVGTALGFGVGYILGARRGPQPLQSLSQRIEERLPAAKTLTSRISPGPTVDVRPVREVMTSSPRTVEPDAAVEEAAKIMSGRAIGDVLVVDPRTQHIEGILTDRDIAVRSVAEGRDAKSAKVRDICSTNVATVAPTDTVSDAVRLMQRHDVRRLPVVEEGRPVGILVLGDVAVQMEPRSVLADISAAPPNR